MAGFSVPALRARYYPDFDNVLGVHQLEQRARPEHRVLEVGCGIGHHAPAIKGKVTLYAGIDPDERCLGNPYLDEVRVGVAEVLPWPDETFDIVFHWMVAEHLEKPLPATLEMARVLKPGGLLLFETPSKWHYAMLAAAWTPHWFHEFWVGRVLGEPRGVEGRTFPTFYRLNTRREIHQTLEACGFEDVKVHLRSVPPSYLKFHPLAELAGVAYERTVERAFPVLRGRIIVEARKG